MELIPVVSYVCTEGDHHLCRGEMEVRAPDARSADDGPRMVRLYCECGCHDQGDGRQLGLPMAPLRRVNEH